MRMYDEKTPMLFQGFDDKQQEQRQEFRQYVLDGINKMGLDFSVSAMVYFDMTHYFLTLWHNQNLEKWKKKGASKDEIEHMTSKFYVTYIAELLYHFLKPRPDKETNAILGILTRTVQDSINKENN